MVEDYWFASQGEVQRSFRIVVNHKGVVAGEQSHVSIVGNTAEAAELEFERSTCRGASCKVVNTGVGLQLLLGVWLGAKLAGEVAEDDVVGCNAASVLYGDIESLEGAEIGVALAAVAGQVLNGVGGRAAGVGGVTSVGVRTAVAVEGDGEVGVV